MDTGILAGAGVRSAHVRESGGGAWERNAVRMLFSRFRWLGTVVLECGLGLFFLFAPRLTLEILQVPDSPHTAGVFQLYGALLLHRGLVQQIFYSMRDVALFRRFLWVSIPFSVGSTAVLAYCLSAGLMGALPGIIVLITFVIEIIDNSMIIYLTRECRSNRAPAMGRR